jgi:hypothetical protein
MPTADQLAGLAAARVARAAYAKAEHALLNALARIGDAQAALAEALARGSQENVDSARAQLDASEAARDKAATARSKAEADLTAALAHVVGNGDAFELLSSRHPLLLLPVRLETRFAWDDGAGGWTLAAAAGVDRTLLVRIYPDDVHDDAHEPELTRDELLVLRELQRRLKAARDLKDLNDAWSDVIRRVGPLRAGWIGEMIARGRPGRRPGFLSRPSVARLLPDRWVALARLDDGSTRVALSKPVKEPLETGPSPDGMAWMIDFDAAVAAGMGLVITNIPPSLQEVPRLLVVGARGSLDPAETADELARLLDAQHYTRGLAFMRPGTPTNSLLGARSGYTSRPALEDVVPIERRRFEVGLRPRPLAQVGDGSGASALARALGIRVDPFAYVSGADATNRLDEAALTRLLVWAVRRQLTRLLPGILDASLESALGFGVELVSAIGHFPAIRIGSQPYGVLPVLLRDDTRLPPDSLQARLMPVLDGLRAAWTSALSGFRWIGDPGPNPGETLIRILQHDAVAQRIAFRPFLGPQLASSVAANVDPRSPLRRQRKAAALAITALGAADAAGSPLLDALHLGFATPLAVPLVEPADAAPVSTQRAANYLKLVASLRPDALVSHDYGGAERPRSLLFAIARLAMLERADDAARAAHIAAGEDPSLWDEEDVPTIFRDFLATPRRRLEATDPANPPASVGFQLSEQGVEKETLRDVRETLRRLADRPPELLEELLRATLGLFSHRLDAWYTALAFERLEHELREDPASATGLNVGAYGVVEHIRISPRQPVRGQRDLFTNPVNGGYVHAPSAGHAAAAAVLRSVHLAHAAGGHGAAFSVDLSSERVRHALELFEGIREGQPLAALLGYRIERRLAAEGLQRFVAPFRQAAPLLANAAAINVVDGLTLLADAGYDGERDPTAATLWAKHPSLAAPADAAAVDRVLESARDALDAAADLAVAESVYQAVQGNPARAGAAVDALAAAPVPAPETAVVRTPRTGVGVTHRLLVLLNDPPTDDEGWGSTSRAAAEPRLEGWARATLPTPSRIGIRARYVDDTGAEIATSDETLGSLHQAATTAGKPELRLSALDLVLVADPNPTPHRSGLEQRLAALLELVRPTNAGDTTLELVFDREPAWDERTFGLVETLEIARQLRDVVSRSRALTPADLALPNATPTTAAAAELGTRASQARADLLAAIDDLDPLVTSADTTQIREKLLAADLLGVAGAAPAIVRDAPGTGPEADAQRGRELTELQDQVKATQAELRRRKSAVDALPAADAEGRLRSIFGDAFLVLPTLEPLREVTLPFTAAARPAGATAAEIRAWLARAARVRESAGALDAALGYADAVATIETSRSPASVNAGQLGGAAGERWVALQPGAGATIPGGRLSLVAVSPAGALPAAAVAGLLVDEWVEVVPSAQETTSVAFHYDAPGSTAPQIWLLGVPPLGLEAWTANDAFAVVEEALALAQLRLLDLDDMPGLGQLLPALVTGENPAGETIGLDVEVLTEEP